jgi:signal transduction histidine kinase
MSLRARILIYVVAVMTIVFILVVATILPDTLRESKSRVAAGREASAALQVLFENLPAAKRTEALGANPRLFDQHFVLDDWLLATEDGKVLAWFMPEPRQQNISADFVAGQKFDEVETFQSPDGEHLILYTHTSLRGSAASLDWGGVFLVMAVGTLLLALVIYGMLLRLVVKPVERMATASRSVLANRGLLQPVPSTERKDEIGELVRAYNKMVSEVNDLRVNLEKRVFDATEELEAAQNQIVLSERLSVAGRMAAGVAHEINNPLGGMLNAVRSLQSKAAPGSREAEYLALILEGLGRVQNIVTSMLQFSRPVQKETTVDLAEVVEGALMFCRHRFSTVNLKVEKSFPAPGEAAVFGHRSELGQVFLNLVVNALDAMESKGPGPHALTLNLKRDGTNVLASIGDTGTGMSPEVKQRAGQFFYSTKAEGKGTGLGLAVVQHIILQHNGTMSIDSNQSQGTTVIITLPAGAKN